MLDMFNPGMAQVHCYRRRGGARAILCKGTIEAAVPTSRTCFSVPDFGLLVAARVDSNSCSQHAALRATRTLLEVSLAFIFISSKIFKQL
jgi:hypothetical protein